MLNYYYADEIADFLIKDAETIIGEIAVNGRLGHIHTELYAWEFQIKTLKEVLKGYSGSLFFEFSIPRMGKRVDCLLIIQNIVFVIEFKVGEKHILNEHIDQVWDYALDLKHFHQPSHNLLLVPILVATHSSQVFLDIITTSHNDNLIKPLFTNAKDLRLLIQNVLDFFKTDQKIDSQAYVKGSYSPTPTIIEAAVNLYNNHSVEEITRNDAEGVNLKITTSYISETIDEAKAASKKIICFVTGVPGAGKTLVGLKVATEHLDKEKGNSSVFLSGNKPLVDILQEALTRDTVAQQKLLGIKTTKKEARAGVKAFIQIIHHYRDEYIKDPKAPYDHVAIFDEAQRAWTKEQTVKFMQQKKGISNFEYSEPEFLISCLDRHSDWAVVICLVGGGQEINTGEAGISAWLDAVKHKFTHWETRISPHLFDSEYAAQEAIKALKLNNKIVFNPCLHLAVSMRSYRAEYLSKLIKELLDINPNALKTYQQLANSYPIVITRDIEKAKTWLREKARGSQRYGIVVSSQAYRLKPLAIDIRSQINHVNWFLDGKDDVRSSYFLEDVATEFQVQGLELDWTCVTWDGDLRFENNQWKTLSFVGNKWQHIHKDTRKQYLINAYRVLLTRARLGMIIVVPEGNPSDHTRQPTFYNTTFNYLRQIGFPII